MNIKVCGVADYVIFLPILYDIILVMIIHCKISVEHGVHCLMLNTRASMNFYNGQWLIKDFGEP